MGKEPKPRKPKADKAAEPTKPEASAPDWSAYRVERKEIGWLKPYERNARTHSDAQVAQLRTSLRRFGWTVPILAREDGTIIAGHGRVAAALAENYTHVPVIVAAGWSEEQCRAYTLADNRLALNSGWDDGILAPELKELRDSFGTDLQALGFSERELARLLPLDANNTGLQNITFAAEYQILIECRDEKEQLALLERLAKDGVKCRALIA